MCGCAHMVIVVLVLVAVHDPSFGSRATRVAAVLIRTAIEDDAPSASAPASATEPSARLLAVVARRSHYLCVCHIVERGSRRQVSKSI